MKHTVRSSAAQMTVTCGIVSVLPGVDVGKITTAAVGEELRKHHIPVIAVVSAVLLSVLMLACVPMSNFMSSLPHICRTGLGFGPSSPHICSIGLIDPSAGPSLPHICPIDPIC